MFSPLTPLKSILFLGTIAGGVSLPALNYEYIPRIKGYGKATNPRLRISREGSKAELSFSSDALFSGGGEKKLDFEKVNMTFAGERLTKNDVFCSPGQDGIYVLLKYYNGIRYRIAGTTSTLVFNCNKRDITDVNKFKTFRLDWPSERLRNMTPSKIAVGSCQFVLHQTNTDWKVILRGCKDAMNTRNGVRETMSDKILVSSDYLLN